MYWSVKPGQLKKNEHVSAGFETKKDAEKNKARDEEVRLLTTLEHELPADDEKFSKSQIFESKRWCLVYKTF